MLDLGDIYPATVEVRDAAGTLVNAATVTFTFTLPDGTTSSPVPSNPSTGRYTHDLLTTQLGLHRFRAVSTTPSSAFADVFHVLSLESAAFVNLADLKKQLNIPATTTTHDEELRDFLASACEVVEDIVGIVARRTFVETLSGRGESALLLRRRPVVSITSVTENGTAVASTDYSVTPAGVLTRATAYSRGRWASGVDNITVTYVAGRTAVPAAVLDGTKELIRINWRPQQGGNFGVFDSGRDRAGAPPEAGEIRLGFFIPNTVMQRLQPSARGPHVA